MEKARKNERSKFESKKGITLVALVVTVIILLILSGITVATLSNSGLFGKAQESKETWKNSQDDEETKIAKMTNEIDNLTNSNRDSETIKRLEDEISELRAQLEAASQKTVTLIGEFAGSNSANTKATSVSISGLTEGETYLCVCSRAYTGGKNGYMRNDIACYKCSFSNVTSATLVEETTNNFIVVASGETATVTFPAFSSSRYSDYGACPYVFVYKL